MRMAPLILVVDRDADVCEVIGHILDDAGFRADAARRSTAERLVDEADVDLLLLDVTPRQGWTILSARARRRGIPVLLMTADPSCRLPLADSGLPHLFKPFRAADLLGVVETALAARRA